MTEVRLSVSEISSGDHRSNSIFDDTDDLELQQRLEKFEREIVEFIFENSVFESILERKKTEPVAHPVSAAQPPVSSSQATTSAGSHHDLTSASGTSRGDRGARKRSKSRSTQSDFRIQLTLEQKLDIIIAEHEQTSNEKMRRETAHENNIAQIESDLEWLDIEIVDFDLAITDFLKTKDSSIDKRTHKLIGEKITRYFNERLKARESLINKLRGRSSGFRSQIIHLDIQLKQKEEGGDTLNEIDFDELKIENKQFLDKIDEKNIELILFKRQVGKVTQLINHYKDDLTLKTKDLLHVQQHIDKQQILYEHAQQELDIVNNEQLRVAKKHHDLLEQTESYRVPEILDYVRKKALLYKLQRDCEVWQRKVELVSMGLRQSQQQWQALQRTSQYQYYRHPGN